jgi:hypothetical protein
MISARVPRAASVVLTGTLLTSCLLVPSAWAAVSDLQLDPGARGGALFSAGAMAPGHPVSRCAAVTASNAAGSPADVRLYGRIVGALAPGTAADRRAGHRWLLRRLRRLHGDAAFTGTLADFGALHADYSTGLRQTTATATYRFTVELADDQQWQGLSATTQFLWEAQLDSPAAPAPPSALALTLALRHSIPRADSGEQPVVARCPRHHAAARAWASRRSCRPSLRPIRDGRARGTGPGAAGCSRCRPDGRRHAAGRRPPTVPRSSA